MDLQRRCRFVVILAVLAGLVLWAWGSPAALPAPPGGGRVVRAMFTTEVVDREPVNRVLALANDVRRIYFFTELRGMQGQTVYHRWEYNGEVVATMKFEVKGPRWRVFSVRDLDPLALGRWTVVVTDEKGWPLKAAIFEYVDPARQQGRHEVILPPEAAG